MAIYVGVGLVDSELYKMGKYPPPRIGFQVGIGWYIKRTPPYVNEAKLIRECYRRR